MNYWLVKSEPFKYSWDQLLKDGRTFWNGVRNYQAANNLKAMKKGDPVFFYHSNEGLEIVGIAEVVKEYYPDHTDESGRFGMVDLKPARPLKTPVTLATIKADPALGDIALIRQSRLSVMPITPAQWKHICKLGGVKA
ncbi:putative RNA-binding protein with PUA-like domain [Dongia mobilis]|uniref:Putative RNA-binding protein with PUA-like domain n=1 Tax=Dongia mobilis TaxID=578943 RepID=A0A4R6WQW0_9PROT|nr:EVE domain-containing protein [Dongia mobilis]TDQ83982.1 putative RNA-binding protein with PUA-like domain [Dongia mobilis]